MVHVFLSVTALLVFALLPVQDVTSKHSFYDGYDLDKLHDDSFRELFESFKVERPALVCEGCYVAVLETHRLMFETLDWDVPYEDRLDFVFNEACNLTNLWHYAFPPPQLLHSCLMQLTFYRDDMEFLTAQLRDNRHESLSDLVHEICFERGDACVIDGREIEIPSDVAQKFRDQGIQRIPVDPVFKDGLGPSGGDDEKVEL